MNGSKEKKHQLFSLYIVKCMLMCIKLENEYVLV